MNQAIRELKAASKALRAAAAEVDDISYILGWADGIDHAASILDDSDTSGPSEPYRKQDGIDLVATDYRRNIQNRVNEMVNRSRSYMAHGY